MVEDQLSRMNGSRYPKWDSKRVRNNAEPNSHLIIFCVGSNSFVNIQMYEPQVESTDSNP